MNVLKLVPRHNGLRPDDSGVENLIDAKESDFDDGVDIDKIESVDETGAITFTDGTTDSIIPDNSEWE